MFSRRVIINLLNGSQCLSKQSLRNREWRQLSSFASLLRNSPLVQMGDPKGKLVKGEVFRVVEKDMYIDFGHKFHCVCPIPDGGNVDVVPGTPVTVRIQDLELSKRFYGEWDEATLLEADCDLVLIDVVPTRSNPLFQSPVTTNPMSSATSAAHTSTNTPVTGTSPRGSLREIQSSPSIDEPVRNTVASIFGDQSEINTSSSASASSSRWERRSPLEGANNIEGLEDFIGDLYDSPPPSDEKS